MPFHRSLLLVGYNVTNAGTGYTLYKACQMSLYETSLYESIFSLNIGYKFV